MFLMNLARKYKGFTLIELLVVIAIIATLAVVVFVALNPVRRFREARNSTRATEVNEILTAVHQAILDNDGNFPTNLATLSQPTTVDNVYMIGTGGVACLPAGYTCSHSAVAANIEPDCINLGTDLTDYLANMPVDPSGTGGGYSAAVTGYAARVGSTGVISIFACGVEDPDGGGPDLPPDFVVSR